MTDNNDTSVEKKASEKLLNKDHVWMKSYPDHINWEDRIEIKPIFEMLEKTRTDFGDRPGFDFLGKKYKWGEIADLADRLVDYKIWASVKILK